MEPGMGVHAGCPAPEVVFAGHAVHVPARCDEYVPAAHAMQVCQPACA
jgi:hypothetical protein